MPNLASLIVTVYNKPGQLRCVLEACRRQSVTDFELIVADDGSGPAVAETIERVRSSLPFRILHAWQEDAGWRKNRILNRAVKMAGSPYLIFLDGDCIPHYRFIEDHLQARRERIVLAGRRVETSARWTRQLTLERIASGAFERIDMRVIADSITGRARHIEKGLWVKSRRLRSILHPNPRGLCGYNFSIAKADLEEVNGFDECYTTPGYGEDVDLEYRLGLVGIRAAALQNRAIVFHLHHPKTHIPEASIRRYRQVRERALPWCEHGLRQLTPESADAAQVQTADAGGRGTA